MPTCGIFSVVGQTEAGQFPSEMQGPTIHLNLGLLVRIVVTKV